MKIMKSFSNRALVEYYGQIKERIPGHVVMVEAGPIMAHARVSDIDLDAMTVSFEVLSSEVKLFEAVMK